MEVVVKQGTELVQFTFFAKANATGGFSFDSIEVKLDDVDCKCTAYAPFRRNDREGIGQMLNKVYDQFYAPRAGSDFGSSGLSGGNLDLKENAEQLLEAYKKATIAQLEESLVAGFPLVDDVLTVPFLDVQLITRNDPALPLNPLTGVPLISILIH